MKYLSVLLIIALFSCKNNSPSASNKEVEKKDSLIAMSNTPEKAENSYPVKEIKPDSSLYTMVIMFYSIGEGIDFESLRAYEDSITAFSSRIRKNIEYQKSFYSILYTIYSFSITSPSTDNFSGVRCPRIQTVIFFLK